MLQRVFISHSSADTEWAEAVCRLLEAHGAACFLDKRDLDRRKPSWATELVRAIADCNHVILLLTRSSSASEEILNEIANASARGMDIIPVLRENIPVRDELMYFIRKYEWVNLFDFSDEDGERLLCERVLGSDFRRPGEYAVRVDADALTQLEDACFEGISNGGYGAGYDKCLLQNGVAGWRTGDVVLEEASFDAFTFASIGMPELDAEYEAFCQTGEVRKMRVRGNDRTRWMLTDIYQNNRIFISLKKTCYSMASFWWNRVRGNPSMRRALAAQVFNREEPFYPNSLCLHVILETQDEKLICTRISDNKKNDYGRSIAVSIGEQITEADFGQRTFDNDHFVDHWLKRSLIEEFNLRNEDYEKYVDTASARVLALSYEGDIYNFALPVYVRLRMDYAGLLTYLNTINRSIDEFTEIIPMTAREALEITRAWADEEKRAQYHPSSYLRALLYAVYKGADRDA